MATKRSKKTTIHLGLELHERLTALAQRRGLGLGELVQEACEREYGPASKRDRLAAVSRLDVMALPVGDVAAMKKESLTLPEDLIP